MKCETCGKKLGEYVCSVCEKVVCSDCKTIKNGKVFCLEHSSIEKKPLKPVRTGLNTLKTAIISVFISLVGVVLIYFIANYYIIQLEITPDIPIVMDLLTMFESFGMYIIGTLVVILIALIIAFAGWRRRRR